jgi:hypothetical protein
MTKHFLRKMTTRICFTIKKNLRLSKEFPTSFLLHKDFFGALNAETQYLCQSAGDVSSHPYLAHPVYLQQTCLSLKSVRTCAILKTHLVPLSVSQYLVFTILLPLLQNTLTIFDFSPYPSTNILPSTCSSSLLEQPPDERDLAALNHSRISHNTQDLPSDYIRSITGITSSARYHTHNSKKIFSNNRKNNSLNKLQ